VLALLAPPVLAQEVAPAPPVGAHGDAAELGVGAGFVDGWSALTSTPPGPFRAPGMGAALELDAGWRLLPEVTLGAWGYGAQLSETAARPAPFDVSRAGAGLEGTWHAMPSSVGVSPWVSLGAGWRGQWLEYETGPVQAQHGVEIVRARAGLDVRVSPSLALAPVIGASVGMYLSQKLAGAQTWNPIARPGLDTYVFAGVRATLDFPLHPRPGGGGPAGYAR